MPKVNLALAISDWKINLIGDPKKWFYTSISSSLNELNSTFLKLELMWTQDASEWWIALWSKDKINNYLNLECFSRDLYISEIVWVVEGWKLDSWNWSLISSLNESCKSNWGISINLITKIYKAFSSLYNEAKNSAMTKVNQIITLDSTWVYSDWIEWNAPFDLILDLKEIDKIIFMEAPTNYEWDYRYNKQVDLSKKLNSLTRELENIWVTWEHNSFFDDNMNWSYSWVASQENYNNSINNNSIIVRNNFICPEDNIDSLWLSLEEIQKIIPKNNDEENNDLYAPESMLASYYNPNTTLPNTNYSKVNDNAIFPCDNIFCITIESKTYNHKFLWWYSSWNTPSNSIEYLVSRSNDHLKKIANSSTIPWKMTVNNFELSVSSLDLSSIFNMWFHINKKPVPILSFDDERTDWWDYFDLENQLRFYYDSYDLDYSKANDLSIFRWIEREKQTILNSHYLTPNEIVGLSNSYDEYYIQKATQRTSMSSMIRESVRNSIISDFDKQFRELEVFNKSINDYSKNLRVIIKNMKNIPTDNSKS